MSTSFQDLVKQEKELLQDIQNNKQVKKSAPVAGDDYKAYRRQLDDFFLKLEGEDVDEGERDEIETERSLGGRFIESSSSRRANRKKRDDDGEEGSLLRGIN